MMINLFAVASFLNLILFISGKRFFFNVFIEKALGFLCTYDRVIKKVSHFIGKAITLISSQQHLSSSYNNKLMFDNMEDTCMEKRLSGMTHQVGQHV